MNKQLIENLLKKSFENTDGENWLDSLRIEFYDDNCGLSKEQFFVNYWLSYFPLNEIEFLTDEEIEYLQVISLRQF
jgi:hypothetical protein